MTEPAPNYALLYTSSAESDIKSLDGSVRKHLRKVLEKKLAVNAEGYGTPLRGPLAGYWKHEFARHRILYRIYPGQKLVVVCAVGLRQGVHATDIYQQFQSAADAGKVAGEVAAVLKSLLPAKKPPSQK